VPRILKDFGAAATWTILRVGVGERCTFEATDPTEESVRVHVQPGGIFQEPFEAAPRMSEIRLSHSRVGVSLLPSFSRFPRVLQAC